MSGEDYRCGGHRVIGRDAVEHLIEALSHVRAQLGQAPRVSSLELALLAEGLLAQGVEFPP